MQGNGGLVVFFVVSFAFFSVCCCIYSRAKGRLNLQHVLYQLC